MNLLSLTLVGDGSSDRCLKGPIEWLLIELLGSSGPRFRLDVAPTTSSQLASRLSQAFETFPCDILLAHRDAERESVAKRQQEIQQAAREAKIPSCVPVVPVRMTEAWLLIDEGAIRQAADNPKGNVRLAMGPIDRLEADPNPKATLQDCLVVASEKEGRHLKRFKRDLGLRITRVSELIQDYRPLRALSAFRTFEAELRLVLHSLAREGTR